SMIKVNQRSRALPGCEFLCFADQFPATGICIRIDENDRLLQICQSSKEFVRLVCSVLQQCDRMVDAENGFFPPEAYRAFSAAGSCLAIAPGAANPVKGCR